MFIVTGATAAKAEAARAALGGARTFALDVRDAEAVQRMVIGPESLDHLVYAAGVIRGGEEHDPTVFDVVLDINLHDAMRVAAARRERDGPPFKATAFCVDRSAGSDERIGRWR